MRALRNGSARRATTRFWASDTAVMLAMAVLVGLGAGGGAVAFRWLLGTARGAFGLLGGRLSTMGRLPVAILPALGGLVVGLVSHFLAPEVRGPGVSNVMEAIALDGGRIRPLVVAVKPVATAITLGSGGSGGRAGPIVQIGSAVGSAMSQLARLSSSRTKSLTACGAAAALAAMFNTPLAGAMFAFEILLAEFSLLQFSSVVVASVSASLVGHAFLGNAPLLAHPPAAFPQGRELPAYALLGVAAAFVGVGFTRLLHAVDDVFSGTPLPSYLRPAVGGLLVGLAGLWLPQVLGVGFDTVEAVVFSRLAWGSVVLLGLVKLVATSITIGSGGSGGIFGPSIFIGAMLGGLAHHLMHQAMPALPNTPTYAVVGMSAVLAAASQAPMTSILALFEMTHDYNAILPLMLASVTSAMVARRLLADSIYTLKLTRRGIDVAACRDLNPMSSILVQEAMTPIEAMATVTPDTPLTTLGTLLAETHHHGVAVVDGNDRLLGVVTVSDLAKVQARHLRDGSVSDIYTERVRTVFPDETLADALRHFGAMDVGRLPVVRRGGGHQVVGMLRRGDIIRAYSQVCISHHALIDSLEQARLRRQTGVHVFRLTLVDTDQAVGKSLEQLSLPSECLVVSIRRGDCVVIPHGDTCLEAGDQIVAVMSQDGEHRLRTCLVGREEAPS